MLEGARPMARSSVVLREEFDDWAILFDPDANVTMGINPMGVVVWKCMDGTRTVKDLLNKVKEACDEVPGDAESHVRDFIEDLIRRGLAR